ncbi:MAG: DUF1003 domain-containing protein [archaeon]
MKKKVGVTKKGVKTGYSNKNVLNSKNNGKRYFFFNGKKTEKPPMLKQKLTLGQRAADVMAYWGGSWYFIFGLGLFLLFWMSLNALIIIFGKWDPYPFILLNLFLSCLATFQAPIILMSQNRQAERDRLDSKYDYLVNRKAEREIQDIQKDLDQIKKMLNRVQRRV